MTTRTLTDAAAAPAALTAFLRGVERRAAVFAQIQGGDAIAGDSALAGAMRAFRNAAEQTPVAEWPRRFWGLLLATPQLRQPPQAPRWPMELAALGKLGLGPRAALLLRLAAGLSEVDAAAVLGIARPTYRLALQRALPHHADGSPDADRWQQLGDAVQQAIRQLPAERLAHLAQLREAAVEGRKLERSPVRRARPWRRGVDPGGESESTGARWRPWLLWGVLALCAITFMATFLLPDNALRPGDGEPRIRVTRLPPAEAPAALFSADTALLTHRDFELLHDRAAEMLARDLDFHAWSAAQTARQRAADSPEPMLLSEASQPMPAEAGNATTAARDATSETADAPR